MDSNEKQQQNAAENKENFEPEQPPERREPKSYWGKVMSTNYARVNFLHPESRRPLQDLTAWSKQQTEEKKSSIGKSKKTNDTKQKVETKTHVEMCKISTKSKSTKTAADKPVPGPSQKDSPDWKWDSFSFDTAFP